MYSSDEQQMEEYNREMKSRADQREVFAGFEEDYKTQLEEKLKDVDFSMVTHFLSERKKTYQQAQSKDNDVLQKIENVSQIEATIYAQNRVKVLDSKASLDKNKHTKSCVFLIKICLKKLRITFLAIELRQIANEVRFRLVAK